LEEDAPLKIILIYFVIKAMFIEVGVVLFLLNIPHLSYLSFLFGDHVLYNISVIIPVVLSVGYIYCVKGLAERSNLARIIAVVLLFIAMFSFPIGSIISVLSIAYLVYFERGTFQDFKKQNLPFRLVGSSITIIAVICILFMVGMISFISEDTYYSGVSALDFDEDTDGTADVIILLKGDVGTSAIETQNIVIQNVINLGGEIEGRTHLDNGVGRGTSRHFAEDVDQPPQVLAIDGFTV